MNLILIVLVKKSYYILRLNIFFCETEKAFENIIFSKAFFRFKLFSKILKLI